MNHYELYDKILRELPKDGQLTGFSGYHDVDLRYLESCDYIETMETEDNGIMLIGITSLGLKFISEGGFTIS